ncbi:glycosyltransferase family 2 protein [aff. Roholtiella sp. LEGE 12411]|uniref:glycosyltransferase family 2 protein n=1 Tax=aff. Roholtiella sp. LEGE 12411 TaxID=1828822 RepID=UPI00187E1C6E|nr:glycosyltransferase family 2 protein [aff. Roholtiella sp. LEGE 12411]MBE9033809.1 glycosyltransferase family 2 protein [aff. Roholtiella sp. LEGE 12411]
MNLKSQEYENSQKKQSVSIIIPCFNESEGVEPLKKKLLPVLAKLRSVRRIEVICVDDGSTDDTFLKLQKHLGQHAQILSHQTNRGLSAAIQTGVLYSTGNIICTIDSDCTYDPQDLAGLLDLMRGGVDIVTGSPYHPQGGINNVPGWRLFLSKGLSQLYQIVLPQKLYTYTSMFRAYRREVLENIPVNYPGFLGLVEIVAEAMLQGYKVAEYPSKLSRREFGQSKLRVTRVIWSHIKYIVRLILRQAFKPKKVWLQRHKYTTKNNL